MLMRLLKFICSQLFPKRLVDLLMEMGIEDINPNKAQNDLTNQNMYQAQVTKPLLLLTAPPTMESCMTSLENLNVQEVRKDLQDKKSFLRNNPYFVSNTSLGTQQSDPRQDGSEEDIKYKSFLHQQFQYVEDERKWLKYKVDSVTREEAIILCLIGQIMFGLDEICPNQKEVPSPEEAKQILLKMSYGDHWVLKDLNVIMDFQDKVTSLIRTFGGLFDWSISRNSMDCIIMKQLGISRPPKLEEE